MRAQIAVFGDIIMERRKTVTAFRVFRKIFHPLHAGACDFQCRALPGFSLSSFCLLLMLLYALFPATSSSGASVQGDVSGVWNLNKSPYIVESDIIVPKDSLLIIQPGVEIHFNGHYKFTINGCLIASGKPDSMILFTRHFPLDRYNWWGLRFVDADTNCRIESCIIEYGQTDYPDLCGGGIYCLRSSPAIVGCVIQKNHAYQYGGGIYCEGSSPLIEGNTLSNNSSGLSGDIFSAIDGSGGGIYLKDSSPRIANNILLKNKSGFIGSIFGGSGGGISITGESSPLIVNNLIRENSAIEDAGGGVCCRSAGAVFYNNIFHNNTAIGFIGSAGGMFADSATTVKNCIFLDNKWILTDVGEFASQIEGRPDVTFSNVQGGFTGEGNIDGDPLVVNASQGDFHLSPGSPCIDAGDPDPEFNDLNGTRNDMGIYGGPAGALATTDGVNTVELENSGPSGCSLRNFPNPFNLSTVITYRIPCQARVRLAIFNSLGGKAAVLKDEIQQAGNHAVTWNSAGFASGIYYYILQFNGQMLMNKCLLLK
jgi:parallel beta-helix repeat protein